MIKIGNVIINKPFVLAPMAGVNCTSFRLLCKEAGAGLIYTQMYHADFLCHKYKIEGKQAIYDYINIQDNEKPVSIQLVGHDGVNMGKAAKIIEPIADIIDINFGCCDTNIIKSGAGAYFAKHIDKIESIVKPVIENTKKPVTAKIRIGYDPQSINGVKVAVMLGKMGIKALGVHGRVATQKYAGKANWQIIKHIKQKLSIPVIGNGDINNKKAGTDLLSQTGCDLAMIGRRTMGDPSIFTRCNNRFYNEDKPIPSTFELFEKFLKYYSKFDHDKSFSELRTHALWFSKRAKLGSSKRNELARAKDVQTIKKIFFN
ncbi:hypothetical protein HN415_07150 [Candidatus Woesearchaeota archaeon]|jgi:tRNA-dihydrouridine synthase B|nr:hypothetical protein [Candidatus Woesearchaeota archaeon]